MVAAAVTLISYVDLRCALKNSVHSYVTDCDRESR